MKKILIYILTGLIVTSVYAQQDNNRRSRQKGSKDPKASQSGKDAFKEIAEAPEPDLAPTAEVTVKEFQQQRTKYSGQVVEITFDRVVSFKEITEGLHLARVTFENPRGSDAIDILVPSAGFETFKELADLAPGIRRKRSVYVHLLGGSKAKALGTRYQKSKDLGERYKW